jgi:hypothetical protein
VFGTIFLNRAVCDTQWKNITQMTMGITCWISKATHKYNVFFCFSTAIIVAETRFHVTLYYVACLVARKEEQVM